MDVQIGKAAPGDMTLDDMRAEFVALADPLATIANRRAALASEMAAREKTARVQNRLAAMSDDDKDALAEALRKEGAL